MSSGLKSNDSESSKSMTMLLSNIKSLRSLFKSLSQSESNIDTKSKHCPTSDSPSLCTTRIKHHHHRSLAEVSSYLSRFLSSGLFFILFYMATVTLYADFSDKISQQQKMYILLRDHPEIRDSYELIVSEWRKKYPYYKWKDCTIQRIARFVQYDFGIFPPSEAVRRYRRIARERIIAQSKTLWRRILGFFKSIFWK